MPITLLPAPAFAYYPLNFSGIDGFMMDTNGTRAAMDNLEVTPYAPQGVPDGGTTAGLLGVGALALGLIRRRVR